LNMERLLKVRLDGKKNDGITEFQGTVTVAAAVFATGKVTSILLTCIPFLNPVVTVGELKGLLIVTVSNCCNYEYYSLQSTLKYFSLNDKRLTVAKNKKTDETEDILDQSNIFYPSQQRKDNGKI